MIGQLGCLPFDTDPFKNNKYLIFGGIPCSTVNGDNSYSNSVYTLEVTEQNQTLSLTLIKKEETLQVKDRIYFNQYYYQNDPVTGNNIIVVPSREAMHVFEQCEISKGNFSIKYIGSDAEKRYTKVVDSEHL
jgi:hypothetical protein